MDELIAAARLERTDDKGHGYVLVGAGGWLSLFHEHWIDEKRLPSGYERLTHSYETYSMSCNLDYVKNGEPVISVSYFDEGSGGDGLSVHRLPSRFAAEAALATRREEIDWETAEDGSDRVCYGWDFIRSIFTRIAPELRLLEGPVEKIFVKAPEVPVRRFLSINGADADTEPTISSVCQVAYRLDASGIRSLRLDVLDDGRRRSMMASFEFGELRIVAFGDGRFLARSEKPLTPSDAVLLFEHFYEAGARAPTFAWDSL